MSKKLFTIFLSIISLLLINGCAPQRADIANNAKTEMIGMSKSKLLSCAGVPNASYKDGNREYLTYNSGGDSSIVGNTFYGYNTTTIFNKRTRSCKVTVTLENDRITNMKYNEKTSLLRSAMFENEQCGYVLADCVK